MHPMSPESSRRTPAVEDGCTCRGRLMPILDARGRKVHPSTCPARRAFFDNALLQQGLPLQDACARLHLMLEAAVDAAVDLRSTALFVSGKARAQVLEDAAEHEENAYALVRALHACGASAGAATPEAAEDEGAISSY